MQHDLYANPDRHRRVAYPLIVQLQANIVEGPERIVAPLTHADALPGPESRMRPRVRHDDRDYVVVMRLMSPLPVRLLRHPVGSIAAWRDDINLALDWLFFGL
jgi:hypothetical protein